MKNPYKQRAEIKDPYMTLAQIADLMGMSRERVRQVEESALRKARKVLREKGIDAEAFFSTLKYNKPIKLTPDEILSDSTYELTEPERNEDD